jgi:GMP synthase-like glutamine amidotransferase
MSSPHFEYSINRDEPGLEIARQGEMMRILVFQHVPVEHPGVFRDFWSESGHHWDAIELDAGEPIPDLRRYGLLVVMGGPMDVWEEDAHSWLRPEKEAIRDWVMNLGRPFLGICLGHQLLAEALGGTVSPMVRPEVGLADIKLTPAGQRDPIFAGFATRVETFQWHGAEISRLPNGAEVLASNAACPVQAMRWGRHAYGFQYHMEITSTTVTDWELIPAYKASLERALGLEQASRLGENVTPKLSAFRQVARRLNDNLSTVISNTSVLTSS